MPNADFSKLNQELTILYQAWLRLEEHGWDSGYPIPPALRNGVTSLLVGLSYSGELPAIEAAGFGTVEIIYPGVARGHLELRDLAAVSRVAGVQQLKFGGTAGVNLDTSSVAIRARDPNAGLATGLWHFSNEPPTFSGNAGGNVVIGIIDTGIDWRHEFFRTADGQDTRIVAIWDMMLTPTADESAPAASLLATATPYGVEYESAAIKAAMLQTAGFKPVRHTDADGHGTHVAGIAAGNGRPRFTNIGVAPEAKIIAVNYIPSQGNVTVGSSSVSNDDLFRDAITYIRNKARKLDLPAAQQTPDAPVVINCSLGSAFGPHDGRDEDGPPSQEDYLRLHRFGGTPDEVAGSAVIFSSGNYAGKAGHLKATLNGGTLTIPFSVEDSRRTRNGDTLRIECWYADDPGNPSDLTFELEAPDGTKSGEAGIGTSKSMTFDVANDKVANLYHFQKTANSPAYGTVVRNRCSIILTPFNNNLLLGAGYQLTVKGSAGTELFIWKELSWNFRHAIDPAAITGSTPAATVENLETCGSPGHCPDVITVANYNDRNNHLNYSSSRGPLVLYGKTYADPAVAALFEKPNVAAPGTDIGSAGDGLIKECKCCRKVNVAVNFTDMSGTSMAAPHVAGLVALMLHKNPGLTQSEIKTLLEANVQTNNIRYRTDLNYDNQDTVNDGSPLATALEIGAGKVNARAAVDATPTP